MASTSHPEFNAATEGLEVAKAFADRIAGKTILVTGVNLKGIGFTTAEAFASQSPAHLIVAGRDLSRVQDCIDVMKKQFPDVDYRPLKVDLSRQQSVRVAAAEVLAWSDVPTINIIVNSAGVALIPTLTLSEEGIEMHLATNHIGHYLLTCLIMPKLIKAAEGSPKGATRVINVSSGSPNWACMRWDDLNFQKKTKDLPLAIQPNYALFQAWGITDPENYSYLPLEGYNQSKVANVLFGIGLNRRLYEKYGILSAAAHPGVIGTELGRDAPPEYKSAIENLKDSGVYKPKTLGAGSSTSLVAALDPGLKAGEEKDGKENYGAFLSDCQIDNGAQPLAVSSDEAEKLWNLSEELVKEKFAW